MELVSCDGESSLVKDLERSAKRSKLDIIGKDDVRADRVVDTTVVLSDPEDAKDEWKAKLAVDVD